MEFQGNKETHDALDKILKRYLLERDAATPEGEGLMEMAADSVFAQAPVVTPDATKEAAMLAKLQAQFPEGPEPGPTTPKSWPKYAAYSIGAIAVAVVLALFIAKPFQAPSATLPSDEVAVHITPSTQQELAVNIQDFESTQALENNDLTSLQNGAGNSESNLGLMAEVGTGSGNQGNATRHWVKGPQILISGSTRPDSRTGSQFSGPVIIRQPASEDNARDLDPFPLRDLYAQTATQSTYYQLDPNSDHLIVCNKGTLMHIPKNAFVDASSGEAVTQTVQIELKELYTRSDLINSNITTISNGQPLENQGMIYVDASAAGRRLKLSKDKDIYVEFATPKNAEPQTDAQLFQGNFNDRGEINLVPKDGHFNKMVPLSQEHLYYDEFWCDCGSDKLWNQQLRQLWHPDFKNTWIASREFRQRLLVLREMGYYEGGLQIYLDNTQKELWKADQMVAEKLLDDAKGRKSQDTEIEYFHQFARQMLSFTENFEDYGLDLTRPDARRQLLYRHVSEQETERLMRLAKLRAYIEGSIESRLILGFNGKTKFFEGVRKGKFQKAGTELVAGYLIQQLGWTSLSKVAGSEIASRKHREIKVRLTGDISYESTRAFLAFSKLNTVLQGKPTTGQLHRFSKVPEDADAWIVVVGFKNAMPYLGMLHLPKNDGDRIVQVTMEQTRFDDYLNALKAID